MENENEKIEVLKSQIARLEKRLIAQEAINEELRDLILKIIEEVKK